MTMNNNQTGSVTERKSVSMPIPFRDEMVSSHSGMNISSSRLEMQVSYTTPSSNLSLNSCDSFDQSPLNSQQTSSNDVLVVSERVSDWRTLMRYLYQPEDVKDLIEQLQSDCRHVKTKEVCAIALEKWQRRMGNGATVYRLCGALYSMDRKDVAQILCSKRGMRCNFGSKMPQMNSRASSLSSILSGFVDLNTCDVEDEIDQVFSDDNQPRKTPREVRQLIAALEDPWVAVVSLAGPQNSGKTVTLNLLHKELDHHNSFQRTKIIKIRSKGQVDSMWLAREIEETVQKAPSSGVDQGSNAERNLIGLLGPYEDVVLILDLSLIAISSNGKSIIDYLLSLRKNERLSKKLRFVISTLSSLWNTSLFLQSRKSLKEIIMQAMEHHEAVDYIREMNGTFPRQVARAIVQRIDCYPFYLKQIAHADIENIFVRDGEEETVRAIEIQFEELNDILFDPNVEEAVDIVFNCLCEGKRALLAQVLTFANSFGLEQAQRVVDHKIDINDSLFNPLCEQGALFLRRERAQSTVIKYRIPKIQGDMLRKIVNKSDQFSEMYHKALSKHQCLYLELLVLLSNCFMGDAPSKSDELKVLEPFTPSDGVPDHQSLTIDDANERTSRVVACFRQQRDDVIKALMYCNHSQENYKVVIGVVTQLNVYYFLTYMFCSHLSLKIFRKLKREAGSQNDEESLSKLNVFIASLSIDANGSDNYLSDANSLYEASASSVHGNVHAHCKQRMAGNKLAQGRLFGKFKMQTSLLFEYINEAKEEFHKHSNGKEASKIYIAECTRLGQDICGDLTEESISAMILTCTAVLGSRHPITCSFLKIKGQMLHKGGEYESAKKIFQEILDAEEELLGEHWQTAGTLFQFGETMFEKLKSNAEEMALGAEQNANYLKTEIPEAASRAAGSGSIRNRPYSCILSSETEVGVEAREELDDMKQRQSSVKIASGEVNENAMFAIAGARLQCGKEVALGDSNKVFESLRSTSSDSIVDACEGGDSIQNVKRLLKKAAKYFLHASGRCHAAHKCFLKLYLINKSRGRSEKAQRYLEKAKMCAKTF